MFIAHLPAGWMATSALLRGRAVPPRTRRRLMALGLAASVLPDADLLWFYTGGQQREVHHAYLTHKPGAWLIAFAAAALGMRMLRARRSAWRALGVLTANVMLHLVLDTAAGGIRWMWPASEAELVLSHVPARHEPWWLNFFLHWTFALELAIAAAGAAWWWRDRRRRAAD